MVKSNSVTGAWKCNDQAQKCDGAWLHGLVQYILGHGKVITKLMINPFVNGLQLGYAIIMLK